MRWPLLFVLLLAVWAGYRIGFGKPFTINQLADRQAFAYLTGDPQLLTTLGLVDGTVLDFHSGQLTPVTVARRDRDFARLERFLRELDQFDRAGLDAKDRLTWDVLHEFYSDALALKAFAWVSSASALYPFDQMDGLQTSLPNFLLTVHVIRNLKTARSYVQRLEQVGEVIDQGIDEMQRQRRLGVTPPAAVIDRTMAVVADFLQPDPAEHPLAAEFRARLRNLSDIDPSIRAELERRSAAAVRDRVYPAYRRLTGALAELRSEAQRNPADGMQRLPDGAAAASTSMKEEKVAPGVWSVTVAKKSNGVVKSNSGASLIDLGDGVGCIEFHSKMNALGADMIQLTSQVLKPGGAGDELRRVRASTTTRPTSPSAPTSCCC